MIQIKHKHSMRRFLKTKMKTRLQRRINKDVSDRKSNSDFQLYINLKHYVFVLSIFTIENNNTKLKRQTREVIAIPESLKQI